LGLRGPGHHLDHITSVKEGYTLRLPAEQVAAPSNLQILPAAENLTKGDRFGHGVISGVCYVMYIAC
jgi:hypothetical protein